MKIVYGGNLECIWLRSDEWQPDPFYKGYFHFTNNINTSQIQVECQAIDIESYRRYASKYKYWKYAGDSGFDPASISKPSMGVMPRFIWLEHRAEELADAIIRQQLETSTNERRYDLIIEWCAELAKVNSELALEKK